MNTELEQLNIFCIGELQKFEFAGKEFRLFDGLNDLISDGSRIKTYINDAQCSGYESGNNEPTFYTSEKDRDSQLELLNNLYGIDQFGNNLWGYFKVNIFIDELEVKQGFGDIFIYGIGYIETSQEEILSKAKARALFYRKQQKKLDKKQK